jgi:diaminohydroxyphosphoribosylaminopyrimidine deaminase/5-amino-6-(5-phosphoribosylamino)uracil reductase
VTDARAVPTTIGCAAPVLAGGGPRVEARAAAGVELIGLPETEGGLDLDALLAALAARHDVTNVLVEGGARLLGALLAAGLVDELWVFVAPLLLADDRAIPCATGLASRALTDGIGLELLARHERGGDVVLCYRPVADARRRPGVTG